jgi:DNA-nicking Smr family endonuclease
MGKLDLHGTRHEEVARKLENFLYQHIQIGTSEVDIVTGNSPEMKKIVREIAKEYNMAVTDAWGNFGTLIIKMK